MLTTFHQFLCGNRRAGDSGYILPNGVEGYALSIYILINGVRIYALYYQLSADPYLLVEMRPSVDNLDTIGIVGIISRYRAYNSIFCEIKTLIL